MSSLCTSSPAPRRDERKPLDGVTPRIENDRSAVSEIPGVARDQVKARLDHRRREQRVYYRWSMAGLRFHASGDRAPTAHDFVAKGQSPSHETRFEGIARADIAGDVDIVERRLAIPLSYSARVRMLMNSCCSSTARAHALTLGAPFAAISEAMWRPRNRS